uniref:Uncharacterized protein n=1 Tax=Candidatus Nitrotoga fabula TaxID=2182327 RepID=A0A2X0SDQ3_9PROT|nr:conserved protein of unknown function [Candidatus Nitrotoga fabula]
MDSQSFFSSETSRHILQNFLGRISALQPNGIFETTRNGFVIQIIKLMLTNANAWNTACPISIEHYRNNFFEDLSNTNQLKKDDLDRIYTKCYRFIIEYSFSIHNELEDACSYARRFLSEHLTQFNSDNQAEIQSTNLELPLKILKSILNSDATQSLIKFKTLSTSIDEKLIKWEKDLNIREKEVKKLQLALEKQETGYNFVGLYKGFNQLCEIKNQEEKGLLFWLVSLGGLIICALSIEIISLLHDVNFADPVKFKRALVIAIPATSLIAILIYYFRIILHNYKSVKSQILQIELRKTLCQFIQNYAKQSSELKENNNDALQKFENIIFSGIVSDNEKLPSTYDGLEQLSKFIKSVKGP